MSEVEWFVLMGGHFFEKYLANSTNSTLVKEVNMSDRRNDTDKGDSVEELVEESEREYSLGLPNLDYIYKVPPEKKDTGSERGMDCDDEKENVAKRNFPPAWGLQDE